MFKNIFSIHAKLNEYYVGDCRLSAVFALYLHSVVGVLVIEYQRLLDQLVVSLQFVNVGLISNNDMFKLLQLGHLVLQGAPDLKGAASNFL